MSIEERHTFSRSLELESPTRCNPSDYIIKIEDVQNIWDNPKPKETIIEILSSYFKSRKLADMFEYNELSILAEYQLYNIIFAKEQLAIKDENIAALLHILWNLLEVEASAAVSVEDGKGGEGESELGNTLQTKYAYLRDLLMEEAHKGESRKFSFEEIKKIMVYAKDTIFKHLRLYEYMLSNKQLGDVKKISLFVDKPVIMPSLNEALALGKEKLYIESEEEHAQVSENTENQASEHNKQENGGDKPAEGLQEPGELEKKLSKMGIDESHKDVIRQRLEEFQSKMDKTIEERQKQLDEKIDQIVNKKKK